MLRVAVVIALHCGQFLVIGDAPGEAIRNLHFPALWVTERLANRRCQ